MSNYDLNSHKKSDKVKWIISGVAMVLAFILIIGLFLQVFGQGKVKPSEWFTKDETQVETNEEQDNTVVASVESNGMTMFATVVPLSSIDSRSVTNVYDLSVTYTPADTTFQDTTYSIAFKNPSSTWATGKLVSTYATITQSEVGSKDAVLRILQPYSEQIIVTATNDRNTSIKASVTVDFVGTNYGTMTYDSCDDCDSDIEFTYQGFRDGTLSPSTDSCFTFIFDFTDYNYERISQRMSESGYTFASSVSYTMSPDDINSSFGVTSLRDILYRAGGMESASTTEKAAYWQALSSAMLNGSVPEDLNGNGVCYYEVISHRNYNGVEYADNSVTDGEINLSDWYQFEVSATGMSSNTSSIIAG
ncbi:MAG: hypothetical protein ACI4MS_06415 [Candidatus Coproplasma sp.]